MVSGRRVTARRELAAVTRSGRQPVDVKRSLAMLRRAREINARIETSWNAVSGHLGHFAARGIPDVGGAKEALNGVMELQQALGDALDQRALRALAADNILSNPMLRGLFDGRTRTARQIGPPAMPSCAVCGSHGHFASLHCPSGTKMAFA